MGIECRGRRAVGLGCILMVALVLLLFVASDAESTEEGAEGHQNAWKWKEQVKQLSAAYWDAIKMKLLDFAPKPNTHFRAKVGKNVEEGGAVEKSIGKAKQGMEESAKSAANMATKTLKNTFSPNTNNPQDEL